MATYFFFLLFKCLTFICPTLYSSANYVRVASRVCLAASRFARCCRAYHRPWRWVATRQRRLLGPIG